MLTVRNLQAGYGDLTILRSISLDVDYGAVLALMGHNGVGKTTLLRCLIGQVKLQTGEIVFSGNSLVGLKPYEIARRGIAYIAQESALFPDLSVAQNLRVAFGRRKSFDAACDRAVSSFPFLRERFQQKAGTLSGGEQKMLLIARALLVDPEMILIDEVTEGVQPKQIDKITSVLADVNQQLGTTIVLVEQHIDFALDLAHKYIVLKQGMVASQGSARDSDARQSIEAQLAI